MSATLHAAMSAAIQAVTADNRALHAALEQRASTTWQAVPTWIKRPDFALVLVAGAMLRLIWLGSTSFLGDQAEILALARSSADRGALPLTGLRNSIGSMTPPASTYLLLPLAHLDPFWVVLAGALANIAAIVLLYRLADRYVGRGAALAAGLLYATAWGPVWYSRFIWQPNLLAPVLLLYFWTLCDGVVAGRRGWFAWNVLLWGIAVQFHSTAAPLLLLTMVGALLARTTLARRDLVAAALAVGALFFPFALWEVISHGSDLPRIGGVVAGRPVVDGAAALALLRLLQPAGSDSLGATSLYASTVPPLLPLAMTLLGVAATLWIVVIVLRPLMPPAFLWLRRFAGQKEMAAAHSGSALRKLPGAWRARQVAREEVASRAGARSRIAPVAGTDGATPPCTEDNGHAANRATLAAVLADPRWRFLALLALWELAPLATMLRHSHPIFPHYLLASLPAAFLIMGLFLAWSAQAAAGLVSSHLLARFLAAPARVTSAMARQRAPSPIAGQPLLVGIVLMLGLAQAYGTGSWLFAIERGAFDAGPGGAHVGLPLDAQRAALHAAQRAARPLGADVSIATGALHQEPLSYLASTGDGPASVYDADGCLVTPTAGSRPQVTLALAPGPAGDLLPQVQGAARLATLPTVGGITPALYRIPPGARLRGEVALPASATPPAGPRLAGYLFDRLGGESRLVVHWTGAPRLVIDPRGGLRYFDSASPRAAGPPTTHFWFRAQALDAAGKPVGRPLVAECPWLAWAAAQDVYSWMPVPAALASAAAWRVEVYGAPYLVKDPTLGPLRFVAGNVHEAPGVALDREVVVPSR